MAKLDESLVDAAASLDMGGDESPMPDESEDGGKADFMRMAKAILAKDFEGAWGHYQACTGMGTEPAPEPADDAFGDMG